LDPPIRWSVVANLGANIRDQWGSGNKLLRGKAPQVGLEPTTLRLTGKPRSCISLALRASWLGWSIVLHGIRHGIVQELFSPDAIAQR